MPVYIMLSRVTDSGAETIAKNPDRITEVDREMESWGVTVLHQWAVLGEFDFVSVVEAPDNSTVAKASLALGARGSVKIRTLPAIPVDEFISSMK